VISEVFNFDLETDKARLWKRLKLLKGRQSVEIKKWIKRRSLKANGYLWGGVYVDVAAALQEAWGEHLTKDEVHIMMGDMFLKKPVIDRNTGEIKGYTHATTVVDSVLFSEYIDKITRFVGESLGGRVRTPDEYLNERNGQ
jgi:hypothetical protein